MNNLKNQLIEIFVKKNQKTKNKNMHILDFEIQSETNRTKILIMYNLEVLSDFHIVRHYYKMDIGHTVYIKAI